MPRVVEGRILFVRAAKACMPPAYWESMIRLAAAEGAWLHLTDQGAQMDVVLDYLCPVLQRWPVVLFDTGEVVGAWREWFVAPGAEIPYD